MENREYHNKNCILFLYSSLDIPKVNPELKKREKQNKKYQKNSSAKWCDDFFAHEKAA